MSYCPRCVNEKDFVFIFSTLYDEACLLKFFICYWFFMECMKCAPRMSASSFKFLFCTTWNACRCSRPLISSFISLLLLMDLYLRLDFSIISDENCDYGVHYVPCFSIVVMSCFKSGSFVFGSLGSTEVFSNSLTLTSSVADIIFIENLVTLYGLFHFFVLTRYTRPFWPSLMTYLVADGSLLLSAVSYFSDNGFHLCTRYFSYCKAFGLCCLWAL